MPAPIDYGVQIADPTQSFLSAFQAGANIQEARLKQEQQQVQLANQKLVQEGFNRLRQPDATAADYANLSMLLPETQAKAVRESFSMLSGERQQTALQQSGQVFSAFKAGKPDIAINLLEQQIEGKRNSGDEAGAKFLETWRDVAKQNPKATEDYFGFTISQMPGGDKVITSAIALGGERRAEALAPSALTKAVADADEAVAKAITAQSTATNAPEKSAADAALAKAQAEAARIKALYAERTEIAGLNKTNWDIKNLDSQIRDRSEKLNLDRQTTQATVAEKLSSIQARLADIPEGARKLINESSTLSATSKQAATQYNDLANRILSAEGGKGSFTTASEWFAKSLGQQDAWTQIRNEYTRVRNSVAIKSLPPGVATDKDIELALKGIPPENANSATLASFLRGSAKLQDIDSSINNAKTDWLSQNNGLLTRAKGTFIAGDYATKPGETFNDFAQRIVGDVSNRYAPPPKSVEQTPAQRTPQPPAAVDVRSRADAILKGG